ncbi:unnamed protein product [Coregonus sp. 'balchen']|nr:unnamed protein product [Coregonus sp. 'balchen']
MAAIVTGLIPILRTAVDTTTTYKSRSLWFGFLCMRLVALFMAEMPWFKLDADFSCNTTQDFSSPPTSAPLPRRGAPGRGRSLWLEAQKKSVSVAKSEPPGKMVIDLHKDRVTVGFYLLSTVLCLCFVYVLLSWNLPKIDEGPFKCKSAI